MKIEIVNYVKSKYFGTSSLSEAFKLYCDITGNSYQLGWTFDFWSRELLSGKEFHVIDVMDNEILDQYVVVNRIDVDHSIDPVGHYYQFNLDEEE